MKIVEKKLDEIIPYENNPRFNDNAVEYVANSIREFGFRQPIVVDKDMVIIAGHTRLKAAYKLGLETAPVVIAEDMTEEQVRAYRIADNRVSDFSIWDTKTLLDELSEISDDLFTGFSESEMFNDLDESIDVLDESDRSLLDDLDNEEFYRVVYQTTNKEKYDQVQAFIESIGE